MRNKIEKFGYEMHGLKQTSGILCECKDSSYFDIVYDLDTKTVSACYHWTNNEWTEYKNNILVVQRTKRHLRMQQIAAMVALALDEYYRYAQKEATV